MQIDKNPQKNNKTQTYKRKFKFRERRNSSQLLKIQNISKETAFKFDEPQIFDSTLNI